jgi:serine protease Do
VLINLAKKVIKQLKNNGRVVGGWLGVALQEVTPGLAKKKAEGTLVASVEKRGPADKAGIQFGDIIVEFDNKEVKQIGDLQRMVA